MKVEDAMTYLDQVKARFQGQGSIYCSFLEVMRQFKAQEIETDTVIQRVNELFRDHPDLIEGFNTFIPTNYRIEPSPNTAISLIPGNSPFHPDQGLSGDSNTTQSYDRAFNYVNKVKQRFLASPSIYKKFLEILQWYQKEQKQNDEGRKRIAEQKVCNDVANLFNGHEDLLREFEEFLPETKSMMCTDNPPKRITGYSKRNGLENAKSRHIDPTEMKKAKRNLASQTDVVSSKHVASPKKMRTDPTDVSVADINQVTNGTYAAILAKIQDSLYHSGSSKAWNQFLQHLNLFTRQKITIQSLLDSVKIILAHSPELYRQFREIIPNYSNRNGNYDSINERGFDEFQEMNRSNFYSNNNIAAINNSIADNLNQRRHDLSQMAAVGTSYRYRPTDEPLPKCSGRLKDKIAQEVLNDVYVVYNSLTSEDSQFISSKKNQYEESIYRVEDERYEVDMVMKLNESALQNLIALKRKLDTMSREEAQNFKLGDTLGGSSSILMRKAIHRVYGDKAADVIYGLQSSPRNVIPILIERMKQKDSEWRDSVRNFQRLWSDQDAKNYPRSLDHQGLTFRPKDVSLIKCKVFINQIESIASHSLSSPCRMDSDPISSLIAGSLHIPQSRLGLTATQNSVDPCGGTYASWNAEHIGSTNFHSIEGTGRDGGPHLTLQFPEATRFAGLMEDATALIIYHVKRQSNTTKEDKRAMKLLIRTVVQDLFQCERVPMSDDDEEEGEDDEDEDRNSSPSQKALVRSPIGNRDVTKRSCQVEDEDEEAVEEMEDDDEEEEEDDDEEDASNESCLEEPLPKVARTSDNYEQSDSRKDEDLLVKKEDEEDAEGATGGEGSAPVVKKRRRRRRMMTTSAAAMRIAAAKKAADNSNRKTEDQQNESQNLDNISQSKIETRCNLPSNFMAPVSKAETQDLYESPVSFQPTAQELAEMEKTQASKLPPEESFTVFYTNSQWYGLLRLIHLLITRLDLLRTRGDILTTEHKQHISQQNAQAAVILKLRRANSIEPHRYYRRALHLVRELLDGAEDIQTYEDRLRDMFGIYAFPWFTLDRLIYNIVRQLHLVSCVDEISQISTSHFRQWNNFEKPGQPPSAKYVRPSICGVSGPLRTRMYRLSNEAGYALQMAGACLEQGKKDQNTSSTVNVTNNNPPNENKTQVTSQQVASTPSNMTSLSGPCGIYLYAIVFLKQASMMLNKVMEPPQYMVLQPSGQMYISQPWALLRQRALAEKRTAQVFENFLSEIVQIPDSQPINDFVAVNNWNEYLVRYFNTHSDVFNVKGLAAFAARLNPVFLMRNVLSGIKSLLIQGVNRKKQEILNQGCIQSIKNGAIRKDLAALNSILKIQSCEDSSSTHLDFRNEVCTLMRNIFRMAVTQEEMFHDCTFSACMQSASPTPGTSISTPAPISGKLHRLNWSIGSYDIFYRKRPFALNSSRTSTHRDPTKFRQFQESFLTAHADPDEVARVVQLLHGTTKTDYVDTNDQMECDPKIE